MPRGEKAVSLVKSKEVSERPTVDMSFWRSWRQFPK